MSTKPKELEQKGINIGTANLGQTTTEVTYEYNGQKKTGYSSNGVTYTDSSLTSRVPVGSKVHTNDGIYVMTENGGVKDTTPPNLKGVDDATNAKMNSTFTASDEQKQAQTSSDKALGFLGQVAGTTNIVSDSTYDALNESYAKPSSVVAADKYLNSQLSVIQSGKTSYSDQVRDMISQIQNREKFSYDVDKDPLFQQALASSMNSGNQAMQDTIGQASALTGGYGSSYATTAGNQAYNSFIEDAYNNLPQYYNMALDAYNAEGDEMYRQLGMLSDADATEYNRILNAYDATYTHRNRQYDESYTQFRDSKTDALNSANLQLSEFGQISSNAYNYYNAASNNADTLYNREYTQWADSVNQAMQMAQMQNTDYWNQTNFDEGVRQYEKSFAEEQRQYNQSFAEQQRQFNESMAEDKRQFNATMAYNKSKGSGGGSGSGSGSLKSPTETQMSKALKAYNEGGDAEYEKYIASLPTNVDISAIDAYVYGSRNSDGTVTQGYGELPLEQRTYTKTKDTVNWLWGTDNDDEVTDQYGNVYRIDELPESIRGDLTDLDEGKQYTKKKK